MQIVASTKTFRFEAELRTRKDMIKLQKSPERIYRSPFFKTPLTSIRTTKEPENVVMSVHSHSRRKIDNSGVLIKERLTW